MTRHLRPSASRPANAMSLSLVWVLLTCMYGYHMVWSLTKGALDRGLSPRVPNLVYVTGKLGPSANHFETEVAAHMEKVANATQFRPNRTVALTSFPSYMNSTTWYQHLAFSILEDDESERGGGYWFWKPLLIDHEMKKIQDGDFILYSDVDYSDFVQFASPLMKQMILRNADLALDQMNHEEREWTKGDLYHLMKCGAPEDDLSMQYSAEFVLLRKNHATTSFVLKWIEWTKHFYLLSDQESIQPDFENFQEHRHDQSFLSMILKCSYNEPHKLAFENGSSRFFENWTTFTFQINDE